MSDPNNDWAMVFEIGTDSALERLKQFVEEAVTYSWDWAKFTDAEKLQVKELAVQLTDLMDRGAYVEKTELIGKYPTPAEWAGFSSRLISNGAPGPFPWDYMDTHEAQ